MSGTAERDLPHCTRPRLDAVAHSFLFSARGQAGGISTITLVVILLAPMVVLGGLAFVFIIAYVNRVSQITAKAESKPKPTVCPACGHKLVEIRKFCAECGASIWPPELETAGQSEVDPEETG